MSPPRPVVTPCVKVCVVDTESGLCLGCLRTLDEIATWASLTDEDRAAIVGQLPGRQGLIAPEKLGLA
jgi:predicted Fe-S protein YdhL (DUF1289 family)